MRSQVHCACPAAVLLFVAALPFWSASAWAQVRPGSFELGLNVGVLRVGEQLDGISDHVRTELRGGWFLRHDIELEAQAVHVDLIREPRLDAVFLNGIVSFHPAATIEPYFLAGVGVARLDHYAIEESSSARHDGTAMQIAVGGRFFPGSRRQWGARLELSWMDEDTLGDFRSRTGLTVGLFWRPGTRPSS